MSTDTTTIKLSGMSGLRSVLGRMFLVVTVTGAKTGNRYTTPVQYVRDDDRLLGLSQRTRRWWWNLPQRPDVEIVLRGETTRTVANLAARDEEREVIATTRSHFETNGTS